jgi:peptide/nickel transport system substrate-binding protein
MTPISPPVRILILTGLALIGCGDVSPGNTGRDMAPSDDIPLFGGTAVVAEASDFDTLNPLTTTFAVSGEIAAGMLFMPLVRLDEAWEPVPWLARSWELNDDSTSLTFRLREDVFWHDGVKTSAHDVKFSYDLYRDPETPYGFPTAFRAFLGEAEVVDSFTFRVAMRPYADYLGIWSQLIPVPPHHLEGTRPADLRTHSFGSAHAVGNGPFRLTTRNRGVEWVFDANSDFPHELGGRPFLDRIVIRIVPEATTRTTELLTGRLHVTLVSASQSDQVERSPRVGTVPFRTRRFWYISWNTRSEAFADVRVRRAFTKAIDRQGLIDGIFFGEADIANSPIPPDHPRYAPGVGIGLEYDPAGARALLAEAGWVDRDGDGIVEDRAGRPLRFTMLIARGTATEFIEKIAADLRRVGVVVEARLMEATAMYSILQSRERTYDSFVGSLALPLPIAVLRDTFHCARIEQLRQYSGICDPELDELLDSIPTVMDPSESQVMWHRYQARLAELQPYTFLFHPHEVLGVDNRLRNVQPDARGIYTEAARWWLAPRP